MAAAPTTVAATATEAAVSGSADTTFTVPPCRVFALYADRDPKLILDLGLLDATQRTCK